MPDMVPFGRNYLDGREDFFPSLFRNLFDNELISAMERMQGNFKVDLKEAEDSYLVEADLPGVNKENIDIDYYDNYLIINAKRDESIEDKRENYVRRERHYGEFRRRLYMDNVDEENIEASFKDGVLKIILPKLAKGDERRRRIQIR